MTVRRTLVGLVVALVAVVAGIGVVMARSSHVGDATTAAAEHFLDTYVDDDGRVVRTDQGGDTVSEGQAYGMLVAAGLGDEARFRDIWAWTAEHLQRDDGLLAWRWADGAVVDAAPAADADLVAAGALAIAGQRFGDPDLVDAAGTLGAAVLDGETLVEGADRFLVAGPWALQWRVVNPSYLAVGLMSQLYEITGEHRWREVAATSRRVLDELTATGPGLVADWVVVDGTGVTPRPAPGGDEIVSGFEAGRAYVQLAVDCDPRGPEVAARAWPFFEAEATGTVNAAYGLDGEPATTATHPLAVIAAAAAADAAGDHGAADELLDRATALDDDHPSYYGAAWVAIARLWLDTTAIGPCPPG